MADLDTYKDKVIVFEAVKASGTSRLVTRQPLQSTNTQILSSPRGSSRKPTGVKPSFDGPADENHIPPSAMSYSSLLPSKDMYTQASHPGTQSNIHALSLSSHTSGSKFRSSTLPQSSVRSRLTPHSGATTPSSTSDHAIGSVDLAGFDRYYASWHDRIQVSYPDYNDGMHVLIF